MKKLFLSLSAALLVLAACQEEIAPVTDNTTDEVILKDYPVEMNFTATTEMGTKTTLSGTTVAWEAGDQIKVLWEGGSNVAETEEGGAKANFSTRVDEGVTEFWAAYPYSETTVLEGGKLVVTIPSEQNGVFAGANYAVAKTSESSLEFKHLVGLVEVSTSLENASRITIKGAENDVLAGVITVSGFSAETGLPEYEVTEGAEEVVLTVDGAGTYYAALLPTASLKCLSVCVETTDVGTVTTEYALSANALSMERAKIVALGNIDSRLGKNYFVTSTATGSGDGKTWETAFTYQQMADFVAANRPEVSGVSGTNTDISATASSEFKPTTDMTGEEYRTLHNTVHASELDGATFHIAKGTYTSSAYLRISFPERGSAVKMTFLGGYPENAKGTDLSGRDPETNITTISGEQKRRLFFVRYYSDITFDGIVLADGWVSTNGGALLFNESRTSSVTFNNCDFVNNRSTGSAYGGAICCSKEAEAGVLVFNGCKFSKNNSASTGGVIYAKNNTGSISFTDCEFTENTSVDNGGVAWLNPVTSATFTGCTFTSNGVTGNNVGGAMYLSGATGLTIDECSFIENYAGDRGGALYNSGASTITITDSEFTSNIASANNENEGAGAIYTSSTPTITIGGKTATGKTVFKNNVSGTSGGAIWATGTPNVTINGATFEGNEAKKNEAGAILFKGGTWTIENTTIKNNKAASNGGAIYANTGSLTVSQCGFEGNSTSTTGVGGGAIYVTTGSVLSVDASIFISNTASNKNGGAINIASTAVGMHKINNTHFAGNGAIEGGAMFVAAGGTLYMNGCSFSGNLPTKNDTGGVLKTNATTFINNCSFYENSTGAWQADLIICGAGTVLNSTIIEKSSASSSAHTNGIRVYGNSSSAQVYNNVILSRNRNLAAGYGDNKGEVTSQGYNYTGAWSTQVNSGVTGVANTVDTDEVVTPADVFDNFTLTNNADGRNWYTWTAPADLGKTTKADVETFLNGVTGGADFLTWLNTVNGLTKDIAGNERPATGWYPGCYQGK